MINTAPNFARLNKLNIALEPMPTEQKILTRKRWEYLRTRTKLSFDEWLRTDFSRTLH
jgi:hypothetical protein